MINALTILLDCADIWKNGQKKEGVYNITIPTRVEPVQVYCAKNGWTVFQSRGQFGNPENYFVRNWNEFEAGFGVPGLFSFTCLSCIYLFAANYLLVYLQAKNIGWD